MGNARLDDAEYQTYLAHGHFLVVIERHDQAFAIRQVVDGPGQPLFEFTPQATKEWVLFGAPRYVGQFLLA